MNLPPTETKASTSNPLAGSIAPPKTSTAVTALLWLACLYTLYLASTLFIPITVALLLSLLLNPAVNTLQKLYIPRAVSSVALLMTLLVPIVFVAILLAEPLQKWAQRLPELSATMTQELNAFEASFDSSEEKLAKAKGFSWFGMFQDEAPKPVEDNTLSDRIMDSGTEVALSVLSMTPLLLAQLATTVMLTLFLLVFGPNLYQAAADHLPMIQNRKALNRLIDDTQKELSRYIATVTVINSLLGISLWLCLMAIGAEDALLWGTMAALLNFAPYIGPILGMFILSIAGLAESGMQWAALTPTLVYFLLNLIESQFVTPIVLGKHMRLNPLVLMLWLIVLAWVWGAVGVLIAVPILVCLKLAADRAGVLTPWVRVLETRG